MDEPWPLQIVGHDGHVHELTIEPGELIYYESAKCLHGRMRQKLRGQHFVNVFVHYRPAGDHEWYRGSVATEEGTGST